MKGSPPDAGVIVFNVPSKGRMLNWITLVPEPPLAEVMAVRSEPAPLSSVLVTVNVAALHERATAVSRPAKHKEILVITLKRDRLMYCSGSGSGKFQQFWLSF